MTGIVLIDLRGRDDDRDDRRRLAVLENCPHGATVRVDVTGRWFLSPSAIAGLHEHALRLELEIVGSDPATVHRFVTAARLGQGEGASP